MKIKKVLIANRGEIALRIIRSARSLGIKTVAIYSSFDRDSLPVKSADESYSLRGTEVSETYLDIEQILHIAKKAKVDAIHPGYGFLSENPVFAEACAKAKIKFVGPSVKTLKLLGDKVAAKQLAEKAKVPVVPGYSGKLPSGKELEKIAAEVGFPILVKAAAGGGGKGMRVVQDKTSLEEAVGSAAREARAFFKDDRVFLEKYISHPRHIEVQILADQKGKVLHLFERECSLQRRHQKMMEESPSPSISPELREQICGAAVKLAKAAKYSSAGTVEFLLDPQDHFYFLEVNARLQVEHPVTETITGIDLVKEQFKIAEGKSLSFSQKKIKAKGHAMECRLYAEDPENQFLPAEGRVGILHQPKGRGIRIDGALHPGQTIHSVYDPMLAKLIVSGKNRGKVLKKMLGLLEGFVLLGIRHNLDFLKFILKTDPLINGHYHTHTVQEFIEKFLQGRSFPQDIPDAAFAVAALAQRSASTLSKETKGFEINYLLRGFRNA
jgi:acetyl-CoA carboxylase biotin carboxylase subunit